MPAASSDLEMTVILYSTLPLQPVSNSFGSNVKVIQNLTIPHHPTASVLFLSYIPLQSILHIGARYTLKGHLSKLKTQHAQSKTKLLVTTCSCPVPPSCVLGIPHFSDSLWPFWPYTLQDPKYSRLAPTSRPLFFLSVLSPWDSFPLGLPMLLPWHNSDFCSNVTFSSSPPLIILW